MAQAAFCMDLQGFARICKDFARSREGIDTDWEGLRTAWGTSESHLESSRTGLETPATDSEMLWSTSEWPKLHFARIYKDLQGFARISQGPGRALKLIGKICELIRGLRKVNWKARELGWGRLQLNRECFGALLSCPGCILLRFVWICKDLHRFRRSWEGFETDWEGL